MSANTIASPRRNSFGLFLFFVFGIVGLTAFMALSQATTEVVYTAPPLQDVQLSQHAAEGHVDQVYNSSNLIERWNAQKCKPPKIYVCANPIQVMVSCGIRPGFSQVGLLGKEGGKRTVITSYGGKDNYWNKVINRQICIESPDFPIWW